MAVNTAAVNQIIPIDKRRMGTTTTFIPDRLYFMRQCYIQLLPQCTFLSSI